MFAKKNSCALSSWNQSSNHCSWEGVTCGKQHRWRVVSLNLSSQGLAGTISPAIGNLTFPRSLNLTFNGLRGGIQRLHLMQNMLAGRIPSNISRCTSLRVIRISLPRLATCRRSRF